MAQTSAELESKQQCDRGVNFVVKKIGSKFPQYPKFGKLFKQHCVEEEYEELDTLMDDFADGYSESVVLEQIAEEIDISDNDKEILCQTIHYLLKSSQIPPPTTLNLVRLPKIHNHELKKDVHKMRKIVSEQADLLKPTNVKDDALLKIICIGQQNHFPLLIYIIDTYNRWRLCQYRKLFAQLETLETENKRLKFIARKFVDFKPKQFFAQSPTFHKLRIAAKEDSKLENLLLWFPAAMNSFFRRLFGPLRVERETIKFKTNDSLIVYSAYIISALKFANNILTNSFMTLPLQIDVWIIPKCVSIVKYEGVDDDEEEDTFGDDDGNNTDATTDDEKDGDADDPSLDDFEERLKNTDNLKQIEIEDNLSISRLTRQFTNIYNSVADHQNVRNKRMVMIIDRRRTDIADEKDEKNTDYTDENDKSSKDKMYAFYPKNSQNLPTGNYLHESMFNLTRQEVLPSANKNGGLKGAIGGNNNVDGNMFLLSLQLHSSDTARAYWFSTSGCTRFYIGDLLNILPFYFTKQKNENYKKIIAKFINENKKSIPLKEVNFDEFFDENTNMTPREAY